MARPSRSRPTPQLALEWTESMRWEDLPREVRDELRARLGELLVHLAHGERRAEGAGGE
jgi:hypothetical protein